MTSPQWIGVEALIEDPNSPVWTLGERVTCTRIFRGPYALAASMTPAYGMMGGGIAAGLTVEEATLEREPGGIGRLTVRYKAGQFTGTGEQPGIEQPLPEDEISIDLERLELPLAKHPYFRDDLSMTDCNRVDTCLETEYGSTEFTEAYEAMSTKAKELLAKRIRGTDTYVLYVPVVRVVEYSWTPPTNLTMGGYREAPPDDVIAPPDCEYLREGDSVSFNGTHWSVTKKWIGSVEWDHDLYEEA